MGSFPICTPITKWKNKSSRNENNSRIEAELQRANQKGRMLKTNGINAFLLTGGFLFKRDLKRLIQHSSKGLFLVAQGVHP